MRVAHCEAQGMVQLQSGQKTFTYNDLPETIDHSIFRSLLIPKWFDFASTLHDPWDLGDVLRDAQALFDESFPVQTLRGGHKLARKNEPIYYLVSTKIMVILAY